MIDLTARELACLQTARKELSVVHEAIRQGDPGDAVGRLADVVNDILLVLITTSPPVMAREDWNDIANGRDA